MRVPMRRIGAEQPVKVMKSWKAGWSEGAVLSSFEKWTTRDRTRGQTRPFEISQIVGALSG